MSLVSVGLKFREATSTSALRSSRWTYIVVMNSKDDTDIDAQLAVGWAMFAPHPSDPGMVVTRVDAKYVTKSAWVYEVVVEFSTIAPSGGATSPLDQPIQVSGGGIETQRAFTKDKITGAAIVNTAFDSFDPQPTEIIYDEQINVVLNQDHVNPDVFNTYRGAVNSDVFTIVYPDGMERDFDAGTCKMGNITYEWKFGNGENYWEVHYPIMIRHLTDEDIAAAENGLIRPWKRSFLNEGYNEIAETEKVPILLNGKRVSSPQLLDVNGAQITGDSPTPYFVRASDYIEMPFGSLNLNR
jgi:hypothetical protein